MIFMRTSTHKKFLIAIFSVLLLIGGLMFAIKIGTGPNDKPERALRSFIEIANEASGITSGAAFTFKLDNLDGHFTNFGILRYADDVRADPVVEEHAAIFREIGGTGQAEVDITTNQVISMHRSVPDFIGNEEYPGQEIERIVREFLTRVYPKFATIESRLTFDPGMKGIRLNNGNYFFRWYDAEFKKSLPEGVHAELDPFIQVGIKSSGFIFGYENTIDLASSALAEL